MGSHDCLALECKAFEGLFEQHVLFFEGVILPVYSSKGLLSFRMVLVFERGFVLKHVNLVFGKLCLIFSLLKLHLELILVLVIPGKIVFDK